MRNLMKKYEDEDAVKAEQHRIEVERARLEVIKANEDAIFRKQDAKNREKKEVEVQYPSCVGMLVGCLVPCFLTF